MELYSLVKRYIDILTGNKERNKKIEYSRAKVIIGFTSRDIIELVESVDNVKLTYDRLYYYESTGLVIPGIRKARGRGIKRLYSVRDLIVLRWLVDLNKNGISVQNFRNVINFLKKRMPEILSTPQNWKLVISGKSVRFVNKINSQTIDVLEDSGQYLFFP